MKRICINCTRADHTVGQTLGAKSHCRCAVITQTDAIHAALCKFDIAYQLASHVKCMLDICTHAILGVQYAIAFKLQAVSTQASTQVQY